MVEKYALAIEFCLNEMFMRVGERFPNEELTNKPDWYTLRSWTDEEEEKFRKWMAAYLRKKLKMRKKDAEVEVAMFLLQYGWTNKFVLHMRSIHGKANIPNDSQV